MINAKAQKTQSTERARSGRRVGADGKGGVNLKMVVNRESGPN